MFNGISTNMDNLYLLSNAKSRSISPENPTGAKGMGALCELENGSARHAARDLGKGWKVNPFILVQPDEEVTIAEIDGSGCINHIWIGSGNTRMQIIRFYWDGQEQPSVVSPIADFFATGWGFYAQVSSLAVCVNPWSGLNCYWQMPFKKNCRITVENLDDDPAYLYYQIDYTLTDVPEDIGYFHAHFRRVNPLPWKEDYTIIDGIKGKGQYVGTYMCWGVHNNGWWGEGEIKFFMDGDVNPTICGTGTEDYFCGAYNFENRTEKKYQEYTTPYAGLSQVIRGDGLYNCQQRFGMYRWHVVDPIRFDSDLRVTIQALGWQSGGRYLPLMDDISSVAYWYQTLPTQPMLPLPTKDQLRIN